MLALGVLLLILGYVIPVPILYTLGWILVVIGVVLLLFGAAGHPLAGRRYWF